MLIVTEYILELIYLLPLQNKDSKKESLQLGSVPKGKFHVEEMKGYFCSRFLHVSKFGNTRYIRSGILFGSKAFTGSPLKRKRKQMKKLSQLTAGTKAIIRSFEKDDIFIKLMEMGCIPGEEIRVEQVAFMGDPISVSVAGYTLSLRLNEAENILVEVVA